MKKAKKNRVLGSAKGKVWVADDFDAPLPDEVLQLFYQKDEEIEKFFKFLNKTNGSRRRIRALGCAQKESREGLC